MAASYSESALIRYGGYALVASPLSCGLAFLWILSIKPTAREVGWGDGSVKIRGLEVGPGFEHWQKAEACVVDD